MMPNRAARAAIALCLTTVTAAAGLQAATAADDLPSVRERAQAVADEVTALERRLAALHGDRQRLQGEIDRLSVSISKLEGVIHDHDAAAAAAHERFVARAVEAYKSGPATDLDVLLSADSMADLASVSHAMNRTAELDAESLERLIAARDRAEQAQEQLAEQKQRLLAAQAETDRVSARIQQDLLQRKSHLAELSAEIERLERQAEREAALRRQAEREEARAERQAVADSDQRPRESAAPPSPSRPSGPTLALPSRFVSTGVSFEGEASWYGPGFEGNLTASGDVFDSSLHTAASLDLPLGTWLYVEHAGRGVVVLVNDRGPYAGDRVLDLSRAAARAIGITGVGWVEATILIKKR